MDESLMQRFWSRTHGTRQRLLAAMAAPSAKEVRDRLARLPTELGPYGVDPFGLDPAFAQQFLRYGGWLYRRYFRCDTQGLAGLPKGRCLLVANHSGQLPYDGMMIAMACFFSAEPPRAVRSMVDRFVPSLPFVSPALARLGQVLGTPSNCERLLAAEATIQVFPEGTAGLNKPFGKRYRLQRFGQGFARLALKMRAPVVPVAIVGAEEQAPSFGNLKPLAKRLHLPAIPLTIAPLFGLVPLPTRYRIVFGKPIVLNGEADDEDAAVLSQVARVKSTLQTMVDETRAKRAHIFW